MAALLFRLTELGYFEKIYAACPFYKMQFLKKIFTDSGTKVIYIYEIQIQRIEPKCVWCWLIPRREAIECCTHSSAFFGRMYYLLSRLFQ